MLLWLLELAALALGTTLAVVVVAVAVAMAEPWLRGPPMAQLRVRTRPSALAANLAGRCPAFGDPATRGFRPTWWLPTGHAQTLYASLTDNRIHPGVAFDRSEGAGHVDACVLLSLSLTLSLTLSHSLSLGLAVCVSLPWDVHADAA
jgi:hypothetical protein